MIDLPSARAGLWRTVTDDGFALAIIVGSVAAMFTAACAVVVVWYAIADALERIAA